MNDPIIRELNIPEVAQLLLWAKDEGWNPGLDDVMPFYAADPAGFIGCFLQDRMVAAISAVASGPHFGFIGLYISHPEFRGRGFARKVWDAGIARLGNRTIGLDGVPAQQENYRRMGFLPSYRTWRHTGRITSTPVCSSAASIGPHEIEAVAAFDRLHYPGERTGFLRDWLAFPRLAKAIVRNGEVVAYAVLRRCHEGYKIGPLFASMESDARLIFDALCAETKGEVVAIDVPEPATGFSVFLGELGFERGFDTMRMYRGAVPGFRLDGVFGVTTLELG